MNGPFNSDPRTLTDTEAKRMAAKLHQACRSRPCSACHYLWTSLVASGREFAA